MTWMLKTIKFKKQTKDTIIYKEINNTVFFIINLIKLKKNDLLFKNYFVASFVRFYFRIIWRGKAYRVRYFKKSNKFTFNFGHSHWCKFMYTLDFCSFFKLKRQNYLIFFSNRWDRLYVANFFNTIRVFNKYTRRGMRIKQTPNIRRFGKISQVNSLLHSFGQ